MIENAIEVSHISKRYHISQLRKNRNRRAMPGVDDVRQWFSNRKSAKPEDTWIWALRDVSFTIRKGESWGLIGRNGSGKTTLLKVVAGVTKPTEGTFARRGSLSSMLGAATGFNPELTGRENVYLSAAILGIRQHMVDKALDQIVDFAGIQAHMDTPVKRYSSGMQVRLAFAIAVNLDPDILLVDEILTVGDYEFRLKALDRIKQLRTSGDRTVVLVSHNLSIVKAFSEKAIWLDKGQLREIGSVDDVIRDYLREMQAGDPDAIVDGHGLRHEGSGTVRLTQLQVEDPSGAETGTLIQGDRVIFRLNYEASAPVNGPVFAVSLIRVQDNITATRLHSGQDRVQFKQIAGSGAVEIVVPNVWLMPGDYRMIVTISGVDTTYDEVDGFPILRIVPSLAMADPRASFDASDMVTYIPAEWHLQTEPTKALSD